MLGGCAWGVCLGGVLGGCAWGVCLGGVLGGMYGRMLYGLFWGLLRGPFWGRASGAIPGAHCKIHKLLSNPGRASGALGIRVNPLFSRGMGVKIPS